MMRMLVDLQDDPNIPAARRLVDDLVGAHLAARDEEELFHLVNIATSELSQGDLAETLSLLVHAIYDAQSLIVDLLDLCANCLTGQDFFHQPGLSDHPVLSGVSDRRRLVWDHVRERAQSA